MSIVRLAQRCGCAYVLFDADAPQLDEWEEIGPRLKESMSLGGLTADWFPAPDPTAFLRRLGVVD
ncbi:hypothetical protein GCM10009634_74460 [Saccharothrix xinjiangensis]